MKTWVQPSLVSTAPSAICFPPQRPASQCSHPHAHVANTHVLSVHSIHRHTRISALYVHTNTHKPTHTGLCAGMHTVTPTHSLHTQPTLAHAGTLLHTRTWSSYALHACSCTQAHVCSYPQLLQTHTYPHKCLSKVSNSGNFWAPGP